MQTHDISCPPFRRRTSHSWVSRNRLSPPGKSNQIAPNPGKNIFSASRPCQDILHELHIHCIPRQIVTSAQNLVRLARPRQKPATTSSKKVLTGGYELPEPGVFCIKHN